MKGSAGEGGWWARVGWGGAGVVLEVLGPWVEVLSPLHAVAEPCGRRGLGVALRGRRRVAVAVRLLGGHGYGTAGAGSQHQLGVAFNTTQSTNPRENPRVM